MRDPMTLAFIVRGPWLTRDYAGRIRLGELLDVWHHDPSDYDSTTCDLQTSYWQWHVHHYRIRVLPWRKFKRRHITRCTGCGEKDTNGGINCTRDWDSPNEKWWQGETGLYHSRCLHDENTTRMAGKI